MTIWISSSFSSGSTRKRDAVSFGVIVGSWLYEIHHGEGINPNSASAKAAKYA